MSNKRRKRDRIAEAKPPPLFAAHPLKSAPGWYVQISWRYGQVEHVRGFVSEHDAESWINGKSEEWLRNRTAALRSV